MNFKRVGCLVLAGIAAVIAGAFASVFASEIPQKDPIPATAAAAALAREEALAAALGFAVVARHVEGGAATGSPPPVVVSLTAGECVAVVAAAWGHQQIKSVAVADEAGEPLAKDEPTRALAAQAQWCADRAGSYRLVVELTARDLYGRQTDGFVTVRELRAPESRTGGLGALRRGALTTAGKRSLTPAAFGAMAQRLSPASGAPIATDLVIPANAALLVPEDTVTYRELHQHAQNGTSDNVSPRTTQLPLTVPPAWRPLAQPGGPTPFDQIRQRVTTAPATNPHFPFLQEEGARRVIAVVDGRRLGVPCVELRFVRMLFGHDVLMRGHPRGGEAFQVASRENVASHRLCAQLVTYSVPAEDHERYVLGVYGAAN